MQWSFLLKKYLLKKKCFKVSKQIDFAISFKRKEDKKKSNNEFFCKMKNLVTLNQL